MKDTGVQCQLRQNNCIVGSGKICNWLKSWIFSVSLHLLLTLCNLALIPGVGAFSGVGGANRQFLGEPGRSFNE